MKYALLSLSVVLFSIASAEALDSSRTLFLGEVAYEGNREVDYDPADYMIFSKTYFSPDAGQGDAGVEVLVSYVGNDSTRSFTESRYLAVPGLTYDESRRVFRYNDGVVAADCTSSRWYGDAPTGLCEISRQETVEQGVRKGVRVYLTVTGSDSR